jgi:hypothetical protein
MRSHLQLMRSAILFRTHLINGPIMAEYRRLRQSCQPFADVWFLYHEESEKAPAVDVGNCFIFSSAQVAAAGFVFRDFWRDGHYPLLLFARSHPQYDYYWMIEYDVRYSGKWSDFIGRYDNCNHDLLAAYVLPVEQNPTWPFWNDLSIECADEFKRRTFFPVVRLSKEGVLALDRSHSAGAVGHCEIITPTIMLLNELKVGDLNDVAPAVYTEETYTPEYRKSAFVRTKPDHLYHPAYGVTTRRGLAHLIHRVRKRLNLLRIKPRARKFGARLMRFFSAAGRGQKG